MKSLELFVLSLLCLGLICGCSTQSYPTQPSSTELRQQRDAATDRAVYEEGMRKGYETLLAGQKAELERLRAEIESLKQVQKTNTADLKTCNQYLQYLRINDYLQENQQDVVRHFNAEYAPKREVLFTAAGGSGKLLDFQVDEVFFYKGYVIVSSLVLWQNADGSGGVGRWALSLDPDKNFDAYGCEMTGRAELSRQDLASFLQNNGTTPSAQQLENIATQVPSQPSNTEKPLLSDATKDKLIGAGISLVSAWLLHAIQSGK